MRFELKVVKGDEGVGSLALEAPDAELARAEAKRRGYSVLSVQRGAWARGGMLHRTRFDLVLFAQELHALLAAGLSLVEALESLEVKDRAAGGALRTVLENLREGLSLADALAERPDAFSAFFIATVRASERTGDLPQALARFAAYRAQLDSVRKQVLSASIYPALLVGAGLLVLVFLLTYVVPRFSHIFEESGVELPWSTQLLVAWGTGVREHGSLLALGAAIFLGAAAWTIAQPAARAAAARLLWRIGPLGERVRVFQIARYYRTLGMLLEAGLAIVPALDLAANVAPASMRAQLARARAAISEGSVPSIAFTEAGVTTPITERMLKVGERVGNLGAMLGRAADFLDEDTARWIDWFTRLFEPLLMSVIGLLIGGIVALMYMPIFNLAGAIR